MAKTPKSLPPIIATLNITEEPDALVATAVVKLPTPLPHEHPFYHSIGRVAAEWARFEHILDFIIWELSGTEARKASAITSQLVGIAPRFRAILLLIESANIGDAIKKEINAINKDAMAPSLKRNRIVHDAWYDGSDAKTARQFRSAPFNQDDSPSYGLQIISEEYIGKTIHHTRKLADRATEVRKEILAIIAPSVRLDT